MKRTRFGAMLMALMMALMGGCALADEAAQETRPYYEVEQLGLRLYVDADWEQYARNYDVTIALSLSYDEAGALTSGAIVLLPQEYMGQDGVTFDPRGGIAAISARVQGADAALPEELEGYEASALSAEHGYEFALHTNASPDVSLLDADGAAMVEAVRAALSADDVALLSRPATQDELNTLVGDFTTQDIYGNEVNSSVLDNAPYTLIDVWATYCSPCISEMPELAELAKEYEGRVQFIGIVTDATDEDTLELARAIVEQTGAGYVSILPDDSLYETLLINIMYTPTKVIVDQNGQLVGDVMIGAQGADALRAVLDALPAQ